MMSSGLQSPALHLLWKAVTSNPMDFQSWTALLSQVESVGSAEDAHLAYDGFLRQFPLCFGYWKKYANLARRHPTQAPVKDDTSTEPSAGAAAGGDDDAAALRVRSIFERAVKDAPFCLEIWESFVSSVVEGKGDGANKRANLKDARSVMSRALDAVGDYSSAGGLWRKCVAFEQAQRDHRQTFRHYQTALSLRLADLELLWMDFKEFMDRTPWEKIIAPPPPPRDEDVETNPEATATMAKLNEEDAVLRAVAAQSELTDAERKERIVRFIEEKRKVALRERERREGFERRITRPHFHVKPLDDSQLSAWSEYLDFEEGQSRDSMSATGDGRKPGGGRKRPRGNPDDGEGGRRGGLGAVGDATLGLRGGKNDVERLYERCLVPCASYWWLWERYAMWKESMDGIAAALKVAERACSPFLRWRPEAHFFRAELLERLGKTDEAREVYHKVLSEISPGLVEGACKLACFERRCGDRGAAAAAYCSLLPPPLGPAGDGSGPRPWEETTETTRPYLYMQLARFQHRIAGDPFAARTTFRAAVADIPGSRELWLAFLEFEAAQPQALHAGRVEAAFRMAVQEDQSGDGGRSGKGGDSEDARRLTVEDRADLWEWFEEFVEDLSMDVAKVMKIRTEHRAWARAHGADAHDAAAATAATVTAAADNNSSSNGQNGRGRSNGAAGSAGVKGAASSDSQRAGAQGDTGSRDVSGVPSGGGVAVAQGVWGVGVGGGGAMDGGGMYAYAQQARDQWAAAYYLQQQQQALLQQQHQQHGAISAMPAVHQHHQQLQSYGMPVASPHHLQQALLYQQQQHFQPGPPVLPLSPQQSQQQQQYPSPYGTTQGYPQSSQQQ